ncbi:hypothetical protein Asppvi_001939 [Aspergillus pseudoviridinutans]|uniref:Uncharacterized protein n=1 Tax=Aspergillus pseudoviridinutans TaxID=1517512 RepID=A0A9P3BS40_9EURO|nr:uncharacterized protein Asppvi_001939 [Aspergillus pseudoviridinutans]GIJ92661.1 hypothetical protein Asppvi_001939 [Aspergillus pseudoviridinutans]
MFLEQADFRAIQMKRDGTAFFSWTGIWFVIDQSALDTGRISVVDFNSNGSSRRITSHMPLLDLLEETKKQPEFDWADWGSRELWTREVDRNAPEYLSLEAQGRECEFNLESLRSACDD